MEFQPLKVIIESTDEPETKTVKVFAGRSKKPIAIKALKIDMEAEAISGDSFGESYQSTTFSPKDVLTLEIPMDTVKVIYKMH